MTSKAMCMVASEDCGRTITCARHLESGARPSDFQAVFTPKHTGNKCKDYVKSDYFDKLADIFKGEITEEAHNG